MTTIIFNSTMILELINRPGRLSLATLDNLAEITAQILSNINIVYKGNTYFYCRLDLRSLLRKQKISERKCGAECERTLPYDSYLTCAGRSSACRAAKSIVVVGASC